MGRIYLPFEDPNRGMVPTFGPILPGTPHPVLVGNPHLRSGPFVALPGYGLEAAEAGTNLIVDSHFPNLDNWDDYGLEGGETVEVGSQFAMDQGEFFKGLYIDVDDGGEGQRQTMTIADATDHTASVWVYVLSGPVLVMVDTGDSSAWPNIASTKIRQWERLEFSFTSTGTNGYIFLRSDVSAAKAYFWMPQLEEGTYAKPARVGAQPASCIYVPSPISETQTPWSIVTLVTPDWAHDAASGVVRRVWRLDEGDNDFVSLWYHEPVDKWYFESKETASTSVWSAASTHFRGDKIHLVCTCDGYNAYLYVNGVQSSAMVMKSVQPTNLIIGAKSTAADQPINGVVDDFAFIHGCLPEFRVQELYRASLRGVPLHGVLESLS